MTSARKRQRETAAREARLLEEIERLDGAWRGEPAAAEIGEERLATFRVALAELVDELVGSLAPSDRDAIATRLDAGDATLRLACNIAPAFTLALYLAIADQEPPRFVTIATHGIVPPAPSPAPEPVH